MRKDAIAHLVRAPVATFRAELAALGYEFGDGTVAFKDGDPAGTRTDVHYLPDLGGDGPHQRVQFWGPRASRDAAALENRFNAGFPVAVPLTAQDAGLTARHAGAPVDLVADNVLNSDMTGAADDTPGPDSLPTGWVGAGFGPAVTVVGVNVEAGDANIDLRYQGAVNSSTRTLWFLGDSVAAASQGQTWHLAFGAAIVGGDLTAIKRIGYRIYEYDDVGAQLAWDDSQSAAISDANPSTRADFAASKVFTQNGVAYARAHLRLEWEPPGTCDITLRLYLPRFAAEQIAASLYQRRPSVLGYRTETKVLGLPSLSNGVVLRGFNLAGAEFSGGTLPGTHGSQYIFPVSAYAGADYRAAEDMVARGYNCFRLPFKWPRLQRILLAAFDADEQTRLQTTVAQLTALGAYVVLDPHDGGGYAGDKLNQGVVATADFVDFWNRLATLFKDNAQVIFGLMNEPNGMTAAEWYPAMQAAINEIRNVVAAPNLVLAPGIAFTGAHSWVSSGNAAEMLTITDPGNNLAVEAHQYFDSDSSGINATCVDPAAVIARIDVFTQWLKANGQKGFLGEFGAAGNLNCRACMRAFLAHLEANGDVYIGWTAWAMGPWWADSYVNNLDDRRARMLNEVDVFVG